MVFRRPFIMNPTKTCHSCLSIFERQAYSNSPPYFAAAYETALSLGLSDDLWALCRIRVSGYPLRLLTEVDINQRAHSDTDAQPHQQLQFRPRVFPVFPAKHADDVGHEPEFYGFEKVVPVFKQQHIQQHGGEQRGGNGKNHGCPPLGSERVLMGCLVCRLLWGVSPHEKAACTGRMSNGLRRLRQFFTAGREGHWMMRCRAICFYQRSPIALKHYV